MRHRFLVVLFAVLTTASAFAQVAPPVVQSVSPSSGSVAGGTLVTINGVALTPFCGAYLITCETTVRIGGRIAEIVERSPERLVVRTPSGSNGRADVEVTTPGGTSRLARAFSYGRTDFVRLLLPVFIEGEVPGAEGSLWVTELRGFHRNADIARVSDDPSAGSDTINGRTTFAPEVSTGRQGAGRFIYVAEEDLEAVVLNLRARDISRESENLGTEIPVVSAEQTFSAGEAMTLVNVPADENYRQRIRIYEFDGQPRTVTVRFYAGVVVVTRDVTLTAGDLDRDYPAYPAQADIDLASIPELAAAERVTVVIETPAEGRYWAFASITNNDTQLITTVTP